MSRTDKIRQVAQQAHDNGDCECVTITISREDAERWLRHRDDACTWDKCTAPECVVERAFRAALEGEQ
jgi:hypothetical protein